MTRDLRFAIRQLVKNPGFTVVAVLTLGLGIGVNTTMFTIFNTLLFRPVPVNDPASVIQLGTTGRKNSSLGHVSYFDYQEVRDQSTSFAGLTASAPERELFLDSALAGSSGNGPPLKIRGALVTGNYFDVFGGAFSLGRGFEAAEDRAQGTPVVVLNHGFWKRQFNADPTIIGHAIRINDIPFTIVGITSPDFHAVRFDRMPDVWVPMATQSRLHKDEDWLSQQDRYWLQVDGRLKADVPLERAQAELDVIGKRLAESRGRDNTISFAIRRGSFLDAEDRQKLKPAASIAMTAGSLITLIAGANLANLLLFRAVARRREIAIRLSLGASRRQLMRQLLAENGLLGVLGCAASLLIAFWLADAVVLLAAGAEVHSALNLSLDWRVTSYALLVAAITVFGFGLAPVLQATKQDVTGTLRDETGSSAQGTGRSRLQNLLVGGQVALSLVLLVCSALLIRTLQRGLTIDTGIRIKETVAISLDLGEHGYSEVRAAEFKRLLSERLRSLPNVSGIAQASAVPLQGVRNATDFRVGERENMEVLTENHVSSNFFDVLGIAISRGRVFTEQELQSGHSVALLSDATASRLWPGQNPIGKQLRRGSTGPELEIIGTVRNSPNKALYEDEPDLFVPMNPDAQRDLSLLLRTTDRSKALLGTIVNEVRSLDASLWPEVAVLADSAGRRLRGEMTMSWLASGLGLVALSLAMSGLYGLLSWLVIQRTREIGIRMALGAERSQVIHLILRKGMRLMGAGLGAGLLAVLAGTRILKGLIYDLSPFDPIAIAGAILLLFLAGLLACWWPAQRATKLDPIMALRDE